MLSAWLHATSPQTWISPFYSRLISRPWTWRRVEPRQGSTSELPSCESESAPEGKSHPLLLLVPRVWITAPLYLRARLCVCVCVTGWPTVWSFLTPTDTPGTNHTLRLGESCDVHATDKTKQQQKLESLFSNVLRSWRTWGVDGLVSHRAHD